MNRKERFIATLERRPVDRLALVEMENLRSQMEVIELKLAPDFEDR